MMIPVLQERGRKLREVNKRALGHMLNGKARLYPFSLSPIRQNFQ